MNALVKAEPLRDDQIDLIKRTIAKEASNDELKLFLYQCERTGLDPFAKQIYSIKRQGKMVTQIGIDGARLVAQRTGRYAGQDGPYWCGKDGVWRDVWISEDAPQAAKVNVYLTGIERGTPGVAHWKEYAPYFNGKLADMWQKMPALMLGKCAEMLALRKAFPQELSGLYTQEEMAQADNVIDVTPRQVEPTTDDTDANGDVLFSKLHAPRISEEQYKELSTLGNEFYGTEWDEQEIKLAMAVSKGACDSIEGLTTKEAAKLIDGLKKRLAQQAQAPQEA